MTIDELIALLQAYRLTYKNLPVIISDSETGYKFLVDKSTIQIDLYLNHSGIMEMALNLNK